MAVFWMTAVLAVSTVLDTPPEVVMSSSPEQLLIRIKTQMLYPRFLDRIRAMLEACSDNGFDYWAISGLRSAREQDDLYAQGRTRPGVIVTNARGFQSAHNFGLAVDFARDRDTKRTGLQPGWEAPDYEELGRQARAHGLVWGGDFAMKDRPHVQVPGYVTSGQLAPLKQTYLASGQIQELFGLRAVWSSLDANASATL